MQFKIQRFILKYYQFSTIQQKGHYQSLYIIIGDDSFNHQKIFDLFFILIEMKKLMKNIKKM